MTNPSLSNEKRPSLVIVEDNEDLRMVLSTELESEFNITETTNGEEGLKATFNTFPDLVIADITMPVMDGMELCKRIKTNDMTCHIPVVMLTAKTSQAHQITGFQLGADDYITKPFDIEVLKIRIRSLIETRQMLRKYFTDASGENPSEATNGSPENNEFLNKVIEMTEANMDIPDFGVVQLAELLHISRTTLLNRIKTITDQTPQDLIRSRRLQKAVELLESGNLPISQIAMDIGIPEPSNFSRIFKTEFGITPSEYRNR